MIHTVMKLGNQTKYNKLYWKPLIDNLIKPLLKGEGVLYKLKYCTNASVSNSLIFPFSFPPYLILTWGTALIKQLYSSENTLYGAIK